MFRFSKKFVLVLLSSSIASVSYAEVLPGSVQPQQVGQAFSEPGQVSLGTNFPVSSMKITQPASVSLSPSAQALKFKLNDIVLIDANAFPPEKLRALYQDKLHRTITVKELLAIVQSITDYYRSHGYISSQAVLLPQQTRKGIVQIKIVEAYVAKVTVTGEPGKVNVLVHAYGDKITKLHPLDLAKMERYLLLANEIPATQVRGTLTPSVSQPNASDLILSTTHKTVNGYVSYDNYGTRYIGPQQITANLGLNSFLMAGDTGQLTVAKTPKGQELTFIDANYGIPLNAEGNRLLVGATRSKTHPLFVLAPSHIDGLDSNYYGTLTFPQIRTTTQNLTYLLGFNYENTRVTTFDTKLYADYIRSLGLGALYNLRDQLGGTNSLYVDVRQGLPILGHTTNTNQYTANTSRPGGTADYTKIDFSLSRIQSLQHAFSLYGLIKGQYGFQSLLAAEQFAFGGSQLGRGYDVAELLGDKALAGSLELRYDWGINKPYLSAMQLYTFYDVGKIWNYISTGGVPPNASVASAGAGIRFAFTKKISGNLMLAKPLTKAVAAEAIVGEGHSVRGFFSIVIAL